MRKTPMTTATESTKGATEHFRMVFSMNHSLLSKNLDGITPDIAIRKSGDGNSVAWMLGHIVFWRQTMLGMLGAQPVWNDDEAPGFRGTSREIPATVDKPWAEILETYRTSQTQLLDALSANPELAAETLKSLAQLHCHETYHVGQISLARRVHGLPGVI
jgi:DinB superfamily